MKYKIIGQQIIKLQDLKIGEIFTRDGNDTLLFMKTNRQGPGDTVPCVVLGNMTEGEDEYQTISGTLRDLSVCCRVRVFEVVKFELNEK